MRWRSSVYGWGLSVAASTIVTATRAWVCDAINPTVVITSGTSGSIGGGGQRITSIANTGQLRNYGNGRIRQITGAVTNLQSALTLRMLTPAQITQVDAWVAAGTLLCFRDTYGQKIIGTILGYQRFYTPLLATPPVTGDQFIDVALNINQVTATAGL